jgi:hypothetical protein
MDDRDLVCDSGEEPAMVKSTLTTSPAGNASGLVRLRHEKACSCSYDGHAYICDERGEILVPAAAAAALAAHGFIAVPDDTGRDDTGRDGA